ncbi:MAG: hypothetical protein VSS75_011630 [Candidatus Parabeggiatoa sp.]|nr:hypothetical protein [Candidatus Parabeggiatoa sp.]
MFLIAQTPRAGEGNHCLIVPCRLPISEREVFDRINTAIYQSEGKDYIAVSQLVEQTASVRQGSEILVLVGVNVEHLSNSQRAEVRSKLEYYLSQFEVLVTQTIDWPDSCTLLAYRPELEGWGQDRVFTRLPRKMVRNNRSGCFSFLAYFSRPKRVVHKFPDKMPSFHKSRIERIKRIETVNNQCRTDGKWFNSSKAWFVILMMVITIGVVSLIQYRKDDEQTMAIINLTTVPKTNAETFLEVLYQHGIIDSKNEKQAKEELERLLCGTPQKPLSQCYELPIKLNELNDINHLTTSLLKEKGSSDFLRKQLNLDQIDSLDRIVKMRNQLRQLDAALENTVPITVYIPLLSDEEFNIAKKLEKQLSEALLEDKKLVDYLNEDMVYLTRQVTFKRLLSFWDDVFSRKHLHNAKKELTRLLNQVCNQSLICHIEKLHRYRQAQSIQDIIEAPKKDQHFISDELGLNKLTEIPQPDQIVAIRNALRILHAQLNEKTAERIFLPLFQQEDVLLISEIKQEFELKEGSVSLLDGLRNKINRKPYRFFKKSMKKLIQKIDDVKELQGFARRMDKP